MKLKIKVTKEVLEATKMCGAGIYDPNTEDLANELRQNCAISMAVQRFLPGCETIQSKIFYKNHTIILPPEASVFIEQFDNMRFYPDDRLSLPEIIFEVDLPAALIDSINIDEARELLRNSTTLELI